VITRRNVNVGQRWTLFQHHNGPIFHVSIMERGDIGLVLNVMITGLLFGHLRAFLLTRANRSDNRRTTDEFTGLEWK